MTDENTIIFIDWDVSYKSYQSTQKWEALMRWLPEIAKLHPYEQIYIRESPNHKVHLRIDFVGELELFDTFIIRALLADDVYRLIMDLKRAFKEPMETNRIFDEKWTDNQVRKAGEWKILPLNFEKRE
jgi:hypothetical protein